MASSDGVDASVGFLYRDRDPKKRRVKPVQKHLLQVDFGEDDSAEDSDFKIDPDADSDEEEVVVAGSDSVEEDGKTDETESNIGDEEDNDDDFDVSESDSIQDSDESDGDDRQSSSESDSSEPGGKTQDMLISWGDGDSEDDEDYVPPDQRTDSKPPTPSGKAVTVPHRKEDIKDRLKSLISGEYTQVAAPGKKLKIVICQVCLGDISVEEDEIVECDGCGVSVHEGCYGISENQSAASTESSASTEPWFCDACKAGVEQPHCELCPNPGGIFKETDAGKWVHIVCALYIPGVAFGDVDKLSPVTLFEMSYTKWGAKECSLCEDTRFSRTGVCVGCDAGMCRTYFHVTCAQREGLLSEASPEEDIADPFYAYCKQHAEKHIARKKRCNWLALQRNIKNHATLEISDEKEKERVQRKLKRHCRKYVEYYAKKPPSWTPTEKMPRLLSSCPSALRRLNRKAELLGINTQVDQSTNNKDTRKKSYVSPAFSVEYVTYFVERNNKISTMRNHTNDLQQQHSKLREQEAILRAKYDQLSNEMTGLRNSNTTLRHEGESFWKILGDMAGKSLGIPEVLKVKKLTVQTSLPKNPAKKDSPTSPNIGVILHKCSLCQKTSDQHMLARCDKCRLYYHLGCLDPPLTRMPKKTRQCGWQCSECAKTTSEESDTPDVNPDAPRKLREMIKEPSKFAPEEERVRYRGLLEACKPKLKGKRRVRVPSEHREDSDDDQPRAKKKKDGEKKEEKAERKKMTPKEKLLPKDAVPKKEKLAPSKEGEKPAAPKRKRKPQVQPSYLFEAAQQLKAPMECVICLKPGDTTNMVRCDECTLCYHYGCLDPPLTKSPKRRGYSWHCAACDPIGRTSDYNDKCDDSGKESHDEKPKRKKVKKTPPTGKASDQKGVKKADGVRTRCKAKAVGDGDKPGEEEESRDNVSIPAGKDKGAVKTGPSETAETKCRITKKSDSGAKDCVKVELEDVVSANPEVNETEQTETRKLDIKHGDKIDKNPSLLVKPVDRAPGRAGVRVSVSPGKDGLRSRTPTKIEKKELKGAEDSGRTCKSVAKTAGVRGESEKEKGGQKAENVELRKTSENEEKVAKDDVSDSERATKDNGAVAKDKGVVAKVDEGSGKKVDKIRSIMCSKEVKIVVKRDLGNIGSGKGKNGKPEEAAATTQKRGEGEGEGNGRTKGMERVATRATEAEKVVTRATEPETVVTQGSEPQRVSTRASGKSGNGSKGVEGGKQGNDDKDKLPDSKAETSTLKECGKKKEGTNGAPPKERTPKKEGSPKLDVASLKKE